MKADWSRINAEAEKKMNNCVLPETKTKPESKVAAKPDQKDESTDSSEDEDQVKKKPKTVAKPNPKSGKKRECPDSTSEDER